MIEVYRLWKQFGRVEALQGLSFAVPEGSAFALIGANGAGKTTMIKVLMNILEPSRGHARILGVDSRRLSPNELRQIGYVSENQDMPARLTVAEYLDYLRPFYPGWDRDLEVAMRRQLRLPAERRLSDLSHGMRMKMCLVCALAYRPRLLVLDEPFSGLDPLVREEFMEEMLKQSGGTTILISSHELSEIDGVATHVAFLDEGRLLFEESMAELSARFREVRVTLESASGGASELKTEQLPESWLNMQMAGSVLAFVETRFSEPELGERVRAALGPVRAIQAEPMGLRAIFITMAKSKREDAATNGRRALAQAV